jgi:hypothetical protein
MIGYGDRVSNGEERDPDAFVPIMREHQPVDQWSA